jgi:hypothetical protein
MKNPSRLKMLIMFCIISVIAGKPMSAPANYLMYNNHAHYTNECNDASVMSSVGPACSLSITDLLSGGCGSSHTISGNISGAYNVTWNIYLHKDSVDGILINQITNSTALNFIFNITNTGNYFLTITDGVCSQDYNMPITNTIPSRPLVITSSPLGNKVCPGDTFIYTTAFTNGVVYNWTMPPSATIVSGQGTNSVKVAYTSNVFFTELISVVKSNGCGSSQQRNYAVQRRSPGRPSPIVGESFGLCGAHSIQYSINPIAKTTYSWTVPGVANIVSGQGTGTISVNYSPMNFQKTMSVTAINGCGTSAARTLVIRSAPKKPGAISGAALVCSNSIGIPYSIVPVSYANNYTWSGPLGSTISANGITSSSNIITTTATSVTVNFNSVNSNSFIRVKANNICGSSALSSLQITPCTSTPGCTVVIDNNNTECDPNCNGKATVNVTGGTAPYSYNWFNDSGEIVQTSQAASGLCGGTYMIIVTDNDGNTSSCNATIGGKTAFSIPPFSEVDLMFSGYCSPYCNGYINVTPYPGSTGDYTYLWNTGATTNLITGLCGYDYGDSNGEYTVVVQDVSGCTKSESYFMENHISFIALGCETTSDESFPGAADGEIETSIYHGGGPFTYVWSNGQTGSTASSLTAGTYTVTVTDGSYCTASTSCEILTNSPRLEDIYSSKQIAARPNPFVGLLNIDISTDEPLIITINDLAGRVINTYACINSSFIIDEPMKSGIYFIVVENLAGTYKKVLRIVRTD